jgi:hypothetical protein
MPSSLPDDYLVKVLPEKCSSRQGWFSGCSATVSPGLTNLIVHGILIIQTIKCHCRRNIYQNRLVSEINPQSLELVMSHSVLKPYQESICLTIFWSGMLTVYMTLMTSKWTGETNFPLLSKNSEGNFLDKLPFVWRHFRSSGKTTRRWSIQTWQWNERIQSWYRQVELKLTMHLLSTTRTRRGVLVNLNVSLFHLRKSFISWFETKIPFSVTLLQRRERIETLRFWKIISTQVRIYG